MLESIFQPMIDLVRTIWRSLYVALPVKVCVTNAGEKCVRFSFGRPGADLGPGLHWATVGQRLECRHALFNWNGVEDIYLTLADGVPVEVDGMVTYTIEDLGAFLSNSEDTDTIVSELAEASARELLAETTFRDLMADGARLCARVTRRVQEACTGARLGVEIRYFRIKSLEVRSEIIRTALGMEALVEAVEAVPAKAYLKPNLSAIVAMFAGAQRSLMLNGEASPAAPEASWALAGARRGNTA